MKLIQIKKASEVELEPTISVEFVSEGSSIKEVIIHANERYSIRASSNYDSSLKVFRCVTHVSRDRWVVTGKRGPVELRGEYDSREAADEAAEEFRNDGATDVEVTVEKVWVREDEAND